MKKNAPLNIYLFDRLLKAYAFQQHFFLEIFTLQDAILAYFIKVYIRKKFTLNVISSM